MGNEQCGKPGKIKPCAIQMAEPRVRAVWQPRGHEVVSHADGRHRARAVWQIWAHEIVYHTYGGHRSWQTWADGWDGGPTALELLSQVLGLQLEEGVVVVEGCNKGDVGLQAAKGKFE